MVRLTQAFASRALRRHLFGWFALVVISILAYSDLSAQSGDPNYPFLSRFSEVTLNCPDGKTIVAAADVLAQLQPGWYRLSAVNQANKSETQFLPIVGIEDQFTGQTACNRQVGSGSVQLDIDLPAGATPRDAITTSMEFFVPPTPQVASNRRWIRIVVASASNANGRVYLVLEGNQATPRTESGDLFIVHHTANTLQVGAEHGVFMLRDSNELDPFIEALDLTFNLRRHEGTPINCDDGGTLSCWEGNNLPTLADASLRISMPATRRTLRGSTLNSYFFSLFYPILAHNQVYRFTSYERRSQGAYLAVFYFTLSSRNSSPSTNGE